MNSLILDQFTSQPWHKRCVWNTLTGLGWAVWIYLWEPLISAIAVLLGPHPAHATSAAARSVQHLAATLSAHMNMIIGLVGFFLVWVLVLWFNNHNKRSPISEEEITPDHLAQSLRLSRHYLAVWQQTQRVIVTHDRDRGGIRRVDILPNTPEPASRRVA